VFLSEINQRWVPRSLSLQGALLASLAVHAFVFSVVEIGHFAGWWTLRFSSIKSFVSRNSEMNRTVVIDLESIKPKQPEAPMTFIDVAPSQATSEAPPKAKHYSMLNSRAANPDTTIDSNLPKVTGTQDQVPKTFDTLRPERSLSPPGNVEETKPEALLALGSVEPPPPVRTESTQGLESAPAREPSKNDRDLARRITPSTEVQNARAEPQELTEAQRAQSTSRPRRLALVQSASEQSAIIGQKMKQAGGVRRFGLEPSFDVKATEFGAYDAAVIAAVQKRWYDLLEDRDVPRNQTGKVVLEFRLTSEGRITHMTEKESEVSPILGLMCLRAIQDPAPYGAWPLELVRLVGRDYREVRFVFYYN